MGSLVFFGNEGWLKFYKLRQFEKSLQREDSELSKNNISLLKEIINLKDKKYLTHYIRDTLGFVKDDELLFEFSGYPQP